MSARPRKFELRRHIDTCIYVFHLEGDRYKRADGDYWIIRHPTHGWVAWDESAGEVQGRPWEILPDQQGDAPPEGVWVSRKGAKSYVYDLVWA